MAKSTYFSPDLFKFLSELKLHNERPWFEKNKARYEHELRAPMMRFISDLGPELRKVSRYFVADPRPVGGSMMRIYRDVRFAKDKSPYKTAIAAHFSHAKGKEGAAPGFYLHLAPKDCAIGAGLWRPEPGALKQIRDAIVTEPKRWEKISKGQELRSACGFIGESLKRAPQGYDPEHPLVDDLKRKDFAISVRLADRQVVGADFMSVVIDGYRAAAPFMRFLTDALGLDY